MPVASYRGDDPYVFVSYAHADLKSVGVEIDRLDQSGLNVWCDEGR
jgi:hypothetical protein